MMRRLIAVLAAAVLAGSAAAVPAAAMEYYTWMDCPAGAGTTGALETFEFNKDGENVWIRITGTINMCRPAQNNAYAIAVYGQDATKGQGFGYADGEQTFLIGIEFSYPYELEPKAICLIVNNNTPIDCWAMRHDIHAKRLPEIKHRMSTDKPLVRQWVEVDLSKGGHLPHCPTCWG